MPMPAEDEKPKEAEEDVIELKGDDLEEITPEEAELAEKDKTAKLAEQIVEDVESRAAGTKSEELKEEMEDVFKNLKDREDAEKKESEK